MRAPIVALLALGMAAACVTPPRPRAIDESPLSIVAPAPPAVPPRRLAPNAPLAPPAGASAALFAPALVEVVRERGLEPRRPVPGLRVTRAELAARVRA